MLPTHQQPSKGVCPPAREPRVGCQLDKPLASLLTERGESGELLNHSTTRRSQGGHPPDKMFEYWAGELDTDTPNFSLFQ
ncbi:Hypothetical predicted protein [Xyrichtys novacula]|uniref:Uncharacterized protein n=1 Tax=Xyrichtys novacula TaxID=13765 RepID=A0AAV1FV11_XYRNO|nr:Hypothetical predicted protein [Xyrichtys novacula]